MAAASPLLLLAAAAAAQAGARDAAEPDLPPASPVALSGKDFLLIAAAARHPGLRGADLSCYTIHIGSLRGRASVTFLSREELTTRPVAGEPDTVELVLPPDDPACRDTTIVLNDRREAVAIYRDLEEIDALHDEAADAPAAAPPDSGLGLWLGPVRLCRDTVETAAPAYDVAGSRALLVRLKAPAAERFARWTAGHVGEKMAIRLDGRILSEPVINEPILGGMAQISGPFEDVDAAVRAAKGRC